MGGVLRAADCYGAALVIMTGGRFKRSVTDTTKAWKRIPLLEPSDMIEAVPYDCIPVAIELTAGATPLQDYKHPRRACYIFGPEDGSISPRMLDRCRDKVYVPMVEGCMNLAATVNVVLYDRMAKENQ